MRLRLLTIPSATLILLALATMALSQESVHQLQLKECAAEGTLAKALAEARDKGWTMKRQIRLLESLPGSDDNNADSERLLARIYGEPRLSAKTWEDLAYRTCLETQTSN